MNDSHFCNILEHMQSLIGDVEGVSKCQIKPSDFQNPPVAFQVNMTVMAEVNDPVKGSDDGDIFGESRVSPEKNRYTRGISFEIFRAGENLIPAINLAARCQKVLETDSVLASMLSSLTVEGSIPFFGDPEAQQFVCIALVVSIEYPTPRGEPERHLK